MKRLLLISILLASGIANAEPIDGAKKQLIDELLVQTGQSAKDTGKLFSNAVIEQMTQTLKIAKPDISPKVFDILEQEVRSVIDETIQDSNFIAEMMYPIYGSRFSEAELRELIAFNQTPLGKKLLREQPAITQEAMQAGQTFGKTLGPKIQERIMARFKSEGIAL